MLSSITITSERITRRKNKLDCPIRRQSWQQCTNSLGCSLPCYHTSSDIWLICELHIVDCTHLSFRSLQRSSLQSEFVDPSDPANTQEIYLLDIPSRHR